MKLYFTMISSLLFIRALHSETASVDFDVLLLTVASVTAAVSLLVENGSGLNLRTKRAGDVRRFPERT